MSKQEIADKAKKHYDLMFDMFSEQILYSINNSIVYDEESVFECHQDGRIPVFEMMECTTTSAIWNFSDEDNSKNVCALNFASYKFPGGSFLKCLKGEAPHFAQEEYLCADSTLSNVIGDKEFYTEYQYNRDNLNDGLYSDWGIYSPEIMFTDTEIDVACDIITCAAPNAGAYFKKHKDEKIYKNVLDSRLKFVLDIAEEHKVKTLILGAFGCGVFKNEPRVVAEEFKRLLMSKQYSFEKVVFAIPSGENYNVFKDVIMGTDV